MKCLKTANGLCLLFAMMLLFSGCIPSTVHNEALQPETDPEVYRKIQFGMEPRGFDRVPLALSPNMGAAITEAHIQAYLEGILARLAPEGAAAPPLVLSGKDTYNASATLGGSLNIHLGLFTRAGSEDELAAVLAHEYSHVLLGHNKRIRFHDNISGMTSVCQLAIAETRTFIDEPEQAELIDDKLGYTAAISDFITGPMWSRSQEDEADAKGMELLVHAGYSPRGMLRMTQQLTSPGVSDPEEWDKYMSERFSRSIKGFLQKTVEEIKKPLQKGEANPEQMTENVRAGMQESMTQTLEAGMGKLKDEFNQWGYRYHKEARARQKQVKNCLRNYPENIRRRPMNTASLEAVRENERVAAVLSGVKALSDARRAFLEGNLKKAREAAAEAMESPVKDTPYALSVLGAVEPELLDERISTLSKMPSMPPLLYDLAILRLTEKGEADKAGAMAAKGEKEYGPLFMAPVDVYHAHHAGTGSGKDLESELKKCKWLNHQRTYTACCSAAGKPKEEIVSSISLGDEMERKGVKEGKKAWSR